MQGDHVIVRGYGRWQRRQGVIAMDNDSEVYSRNHGRDGMDQETKFLSEIWPKDQLPALTTRITLQCEGAAFKRIYRLDPNKLKEPGIAGIQLIVATLGGAWGTTALEERFEFFERASYGVQQKPDESSDSYLSRHDICFEELLSQNVSLEEVRAYILVRQSLLQLEDKKRIVVEQGGFLTYEKVRSAMRLLDSTWIWQSIPQQGP